MGETEIIKMTKFYIKTYSIGEEHIPENLTRFKEYTIIEKEFNGKPYCEMSITKEKVGWVDDPELKSTLYNYINISWFDLEQTKKNIVIINTGNGGSEVDIVDSDGNLIE